MRCMDSYPGTCWQKTSYWLAHPCTDVFAAVSDVWRKGSSKWSSKNCKYSFWSKHTPTCLNMNMWQTRLYCPILYRIHVMLVVLQLNLTAAHLGLGSVLEIWNVFRFLFQSSCYADARRRGECCPLLHWCHDIRWHMFKNSRIRRVNWFLNYDIKRQGSGQSLTHSLPLTDSVSQWHWLTVAHSHIHSRHSHCYRFVYRSGFDISWFAILNTLKNKTWKLNNLGLIGNIEWFNRRSTIYVNE